MNIDKKVTQWLKIKANIINMKITNLMPRPQPRG